MEAERYAAIEYRKKFYPGTGGFVGSQGYGGGGGFEPPSNANGVKVYSPYANEGTGGGPSLGGGAGPWG